MFLVHVASAVDREYLPHVLTVASSIARTSEAGVLYHVLYDGPDSPITEAVENFRDGQVRCQLYRVTNPLIDLPRKGYLTSAAYLRLNMPPVLRDLQRVIYLDADVVVHRDLRELFDIDMQGCVVAGAVDLYLLAHRSINRDAGDSRLADYFERILNVDPERYINTGVMLVDLQALREADFTSRALAIARTRHHEFTMFDQDIINTLFREKIRFIHPRWNFIQLLTEAEAAALPLQFHEAARIQRATPYITHYAGDRKPWHTAA